MNATRDELRRAHKLGTVAGRQIMVLATRMTLSKATGSEVAALSRELSRLMLQTLGKSGQTDDPVSQAKRNRDQKIAEARQAAD